MEHIHLTSTIGTRSAWLAARCNGTRHGRQPRDRPARLPRRSTPATTAATYSFEDVSLDLEGGGNFALGLFYVEQIGATPPSAQGAPSLRRGRWDGRRSSSWERRQGPPNYPPSWLDAESIAADSFGGVVDVDGGSGSARSGTPSPTTALMSTAAMANGPPAVTVVDKYSRTFPRYRLLVRQERPSSTSRSRRRPVSGAEGRGRRHPRLGDAAPVGGAIAIQANTQSPPRWPRTPLTTRRSPRLSRGRRGGWIPGGVHRGLSCRRHALRRRAAGHLPRP